jgi:HNH endonuclease
MGGDIVCRALEIQEPTRSVGAACRGQEVRLRFWVGVTDKDWFDFLRARSPDEVNFWQPSPAPLARFLEPGIPFLFKLHAPDNFIVGGGFFVRFSVLPSRIAWEAFGEKNGAADYPALRARLARYRGAVKGDPDIGCNILNAPFFWEERDWVAVPPDWSPNIVRGKTYDTAAPAGLRLWNQVEARFAEQSLSVLTADEGARYGADYLTRARLGQGAFRVLVTEAYARRCAITGERTLPVLEAAHIRPFAEAGPHVLSNGLLLRSDLHTLFDRGYVTVTGDHHVEVSRRLREEFENGRDYYKHQGQLLASVPAARDERPAPDFLHWHNEHVFLG